MSSILFPSKRPIVLVASVSSSQEETHSQGESEQTFSWMVDETVVALTRAAISRGIPLAVPMDMVYAPLVAHVASEYVSPEVAEGESQRAFDGDRDIGPRAVCFLSLEQTPVGSERLVNSGWTDVFRELKVVSNEILPFQKFIETAHPLGIVGIGQGPAIDAFFNVSASSQIPCWRLATSVVSGSRRPEVGQSYSEEIEQRLVKLRKELILMPVNAGSRLFGNGGDKVDAPPFFRAYPPLALYSQMLIEHLVEAGRGGTEPLRRLN